MLRHPSDDEKELLEILADYMPQDESWDDLELEMKLWVLKSAFRDMFGWEFERADAGRFIYDDAPGLSAGTELFALKWSLLNKEIHPKLR